MGLRDEVQIYPHDLTKVEAEIMSTCRDIVTQVSGGIEKMSVLQCSRISSIHHHNNTYYVYILYNYVFIA